METTTIKTTEDVRFTRAEEIQNLVKKFTAHHHWEMTMVGIEKEDFIQEVLTNIYTRKGLDSFDAEKCRSFDSLIYRMAKNYLIDLKRSKYGAKSRQNTDGSPIRTVSMNAMTARHGAEEFALEDVIAADRDSATLLMELLDSVPETQISPNYDLTWKGLLVKILKGKAVVDAEGNETDPDEALAQDVGISTSRIKQLKKDLCSKYARPLFINNERCGNFLQFAKVVEA